jgi:hypothetical protein
MNRASLEVAEQRAKVIGKAIKGFLPEGYGFTLILYSYGEGGVMTYISSGQREDCIKMLREAADKIEEEKKE